MRFSIADAWDHDAEMRGWRDRDAPVPLPEHWVARWREHTDPAAPLALCAERRAPDGRLYRRFLVMSRELMADRIGPQALADQLEHDYQAALLPPRETP